MSDKRRVFGGAMSYLLVLAAMLVVGNAVRAAEDSSSEVYAELSPEELDSLVAPIALYPDALVAQVLGAATYPDQVVEANQFLKVNRDLAGSALQAQVEARGWDPAVQALASFPSVLEQLANNIAWTSALGDAAANQQANVMAAIQRMRTRAYSAGTLKTGPEITVIQQSPRVIVIEPPTPTVIYVPTYNPTVVYGAPVVVPGYSSQVAAASVITFDVGVAVVAAAGGSCRYGVSWGMGWTTSSIYCGSGPYYGNPYWRGGYYPGFYPGYRPPYYYPPPRPPYPPGAYPPGRYPPGGYPPGAPPRPVHPIAPPTAGARPPPAGPGSGSSNRPRPPTDTGRPGGPGPPPVAGGGRPTGPATLPAPGGSGRPTGPSTRPSGGGGTLPSAPSARPNDRAARGYGPSTQPARQNAFAGTGGGRPQSARGNASMGAAGARPPAGGARK